MDKRREYCKMDRRVNVKEYGALGDGSLCTQAVNAAIKSLAKSGGTLFFPNGRYVVGTLFLESNITICLDRLTVIEGSKNIEDYHVEHTGCIEAPSFNGCLLIAEDKENIKITGGRICGNGGGFEGERPMLTRFVRCKNIIIEDIALGESASWCNHFVLCDRIHINRVNVLNKVNGNNDGFDFDDCKNIFISGCTINTGDDSICLKSSSGGICENIMVSDCVISSRTAAFKTGTASKGGFRNITVTNCIFTDCDLGCIKLICVDGGLLENITFSNIVMDRVGSPLFIRLGRRNLKFDTPQEMDYLTKGIKNEDEPGIIRNIMISNVRANVTVTQKDCTPIMITGINSRTIEKVQLSNINITYPGGGTDEDTKAEVSEDEFRYPEQYFFGVLPAYAIFARHINGLWLNNIYAETQSEDARKPYIFEDVINFKSINCNFLSEGEF